MRKPRARLEDLDDLIRAADAELARELAPLRVRVIDRGRVVLAFLHRPKLLHLPTMEPISGAVTRTVTEAFR